MFLGFVLKKLLFSVYFFGVCSISLYFAIIGIKHFFLYFQLKHDIAFLSQKKERLENQEKALLQEYKHLNSEAYWEYLARKELGFVKKGETVYKLLY